MQQYLRDKSITNLDAALKLKESPNHHHCSSIHCSYFSCFQVVKHILINLFEENEDEVYAKRKTEPNKQMGEHEYYINNLYLKLLEQKRPENAKEFKNQIKELKILRTQSDYANVLIDQKQSNQAYRLAEDILKLLKSNFRYDNQ